MRHGDCPSKVLLVRVWVILDRPPNDPSPSQEGTLHQLFTLQSILAGCEFGGRFSFDTGPREDR